MDDKQVERLPRMGFLTEEFFQSGQVRSSIRCWHPRFLSIKIGDYVKMRSLKSMALAKVTKISGPMTFADIRKTRIKLHSPRPEPQQFIDDLMFEHPDLNEFSIFMIMEMRVISPLEERLWNEPAELIVETDGVPGQVIPEQLYKLKAGQYWLIPKETGPEEVLAMVFGKWCQEIYTAGRLATEETWVIHSEDRDAL